jgi:hypothetical protein
MLNLPRRRDKLSALGIDVRARRPFFLITDTRPRLMVFIPLDGGGSNCERRPLFRTGNARRRTSCMRKNSAFLIISPPLGHCLRLNVRGVECERCERSCAYKAVSDLLDQRQTEVTDLVKTTLESLGNNENQQAINAFNHASQAVQDVAGATVAFEVYHHHHFA